MSYCRYFASFKHNVHTFQQKSLFIFTTDTPYWPLESARLYQTQYTAIFIEVSLNPWPVPPRLYVWILSAFSSIKVSGLMESFSYGISIHCINILLFAENIAVSHPQLEPSHISCGLAIHRVTATITNRKLVSEKLPHTKRIIWS